jgi:hypothetical protein
VFLKTLKAKSALLDDKKVTASDYALIVRHVPHDWDQERLKEEIETLYGECFKAEVVDVNYVCDIKEIAKEQTKLAKLNIELRICEI